MEDSLHLDGVAIANNGLVTEMEAQRGKMFGCGMAVIPLGTGVVPVEEVFNENPGYHNWIQNADFPLYTKKVLTAIRLKNFNK